MSTISSSFRLVAPPAVTRVALAFLATNVVLGAVAILNDWRVAVDRPDDGTAAETFALYGTALSGPLMPVALTVLLGLLAARPDRYGRAAAALLAVLAILITINGIRPLSADDIEPTPEAAAVAGGLIFTAFGLALALTALRALVRR